MEKEGREGRGESWEEREQRAQVHISPEQTWNNQVEPGPLAVDLDMELSAGSAGVRYFSQAEKQNTHK